MVLVMDLVDELLEELWLVYLLELVKVE
jgi:hypothetical protein